MKLANVHMKPSWPPSHFSMITHERTPVLTTPHVLKPAQDKLQTADEVFRSMERIQKKGVAVSGLGGAGKFLNYIRVQACC